MGMCSKTTLFFCSLALVTGISAQEKQTVRPQPSGVVSGRVFCADTNSPARKANVVLARVDTVEQFAAGRNKNVDYAGSAVETLLDGSFTIPNVPPGAYYVMASAPGYISPLAHLVLPPDDSANPPTVNKPSISAPRLMVQPNLPVSVTVSIERGAAVSGTVLYDDGSPASSVDLELLVKSRDKWTHIPLIPGERDSHTGTTDDQGHYRIAGLPPGEYVVDAEFTLSKTSFTTDAAGRLVAVSERLYVADVYSGDTTRIKAAVPFKLTAGENRPGEDLYIPLSKLHTVRGILVAARDGHQLNGGKLSLLYVDDQSVAYEATLSKAEEAFTFNYVLEGDYTLRVDSASDVDYKEVAVPGAIPPTKTEGHDIRTYGSTDKPLHVAGELSDLVISVPERTVEKGSFAQ
jgi:hypothetical protein